MKFKVGDVCITQNTRYPLLNDGQLVKILEIIPDAIDRQGQAVPYLIGRVDGGAHASISVISTGLCSWYKYRLAKCAEYKLRLAPPPDEDLEDVLQFVLLEATELAEVAS
jgi:hypothetical protein